MTETGGRTPDLRSSVARDMQPFECRVTEEGVRRYCQATGRLWDGTVPWMFLSHLGGYRVEGTERPDGLSGRAAWAALPGELPRTLVAGMEWDLGVRPAIGDTIVLSGRCTSVEERRGRSSGTFLRSVVEVSYHRADGVWVATQRLIRIHR